ncbi:MAG: DUF4386 domain-containing protein [Anaerolineae bacterium]|nr:DUF4386 domain-containing protein [Anaerolineae bacterium]
MNTVNKTSRMLGLAFLFQFITSFASNVFLKQTWLVEGDIGETMVRIAQRPWLVRATMLLDMLTALGVIFLGAVLYVTLRKQNDKLALTALGFYILEGAVLAASKLDTFSLLRLSQEYMVAGQPTGLLLMAQIASESMEFVGGTLHSLAFCLGALLFYALLDRSRLAPRILSLWGLITMIPFLFGIPLAIMGYEIPFILYVPFELAIGLWMLIKGIAEIDHSKPLRAQGA